MHLMPVNKNRGMMLGLQNWSQNRMELQVLGVGVRIFYLIPDINLITY